MEANTAKLLNEMKNLRNKIDQIDRDIVAKLDARLKVIIEISKVKKELNLPTVNFDRELEVIVNVIGASDEFNDNEISTIFKTIIEQGKVSLKDRRF